LRPFAPVGTATRRIERLRQALFLISSDDYPIDLSFQHFGIPFPTNGTILAKIIENNNDSESFPTLNNKLIG
jgi:hypothetical protein